MFILLPPSETKGFGTNGQKLNLAKMSFGILTQNRTRVSEQLVGLSKTPKKACTVLGISQKQIAEVESNSQLFSANTSPAIEIYSGVLFDALNYKSLSKVAKQKADSILLITSSLFGLLTPQDLIPHYRLSGDVVLPKIGAISKTWTEPIDAALQSRNPDFIVDMRSGTFAKFWQPSGDLVEKTAVIKIMTRVGKGKTAKKIAISHNNKHTKGLIARDLVSLRTFPKNSKQLLSKLKTLNWDCELTVQYGKPDLLEVFI